MDNTKQCSDCKEHLPANRFRLKIKGGKYRDSICKSCKSVRGIKWYNKNKDKTKERALAYTNKKRDEVCLKLLEYLKGKSCVMCGNNDIRILEFDHIDPRNKVDSVSKFILWKNWENAEREIKKCQILCPNCHRLKTLEQVNSRRLRLASLVQKL